MTTVTSKVFKSGNSEAVRLPKEMAYGRNMEVTVTKSGDARIIRPKKSKLTVAEMFKLLDDLPAPNEVQERDTDLIPERPRL